MILRSLILAACILALAPTAQAATSREMLDLLAQCTDIKDGTERLACYDKNALQLRETLAAIKKPAERTEEDKTSIFGFDLGGVFGSREGPTSQEEFGKNQMPQPAPEEGAVIESITANVTDYAKTPFGKFIVFLDNGQVWRQIDSDTGISHFERDAKANKVVISRGLLGSYNLKINDGNATFKVKRLK